MALSANTSLVASGSLGTRPFPQSCTVKNASVIYQGAMLGREHATGNLVPLDDASDRSWVGIALQAQTGDGVQTTKCSFIPTEGYVQNATVAGFTAQSKCGQPVFATADNTLTLTRPADDAVAVGITVQWSGTSGTGDVLLFSEAEYSALKMAGGDKKRINLASVNLADIATTSLLKWTAYGHGKIVLVGAKCFKVASTSSKAATLAWDIGGTAVTTGSVALTTANMGQTTSTEVTATPTALNEFYDGDVITITPSSVTAFSEGSAVVFMEIEYLP